MPCPFTGPKMFCAGPKILSQPKDLTAFCAGTKINFTECKSYFCLAQNICNCQNMYLNNFFGLAQKSWTSPKHFGTCKRTGHYPAINGCSNSQHATISATEILSPHKYFFCPLSNQIFSIASKVLCILSQYLETSFESSGFALRKGIKNLDCGNQKKKEAKTICSNNCSRISTELEFLLL